MACGRMLTHEHVVDELEAQQARPHRRVAEQVAGQDGQQRLLHAPDVARLHEDLADGRRGDAVDEPREHLRAVVHHLLEAAELLLGDLALALEPVVDRGRRSRRRCSSPDRRPTRTSGRRRRRRRRPSRSGRRGRTWSRRSSCRWLVARLDQRGVLQALGELGRERDGLHQEVARACALAVLLEVGRDAPPRRRWWCRRAAG